MKKKHNNIRMQEFRLFSAILTNGSISSAAELLGLSQSSASKQLKTLRAYFGDKLFVRSGAGMIATNKALLIAPQIIKLNNILENLKGEIEFDPANVKRDFVISTTDDLQHILLPLLLKKINSESPQSRVIFKVLDRDYAAKQLEVGNVDLVITLNWQGPLHLKQRKVFSDKFAVICKKNHPILKKPLTLKRYLSAEHMMVSPLGTVIGPVDEILNSLGHKRKVNLAVPYFMQAGQALLSSDMILTLQKKTCEEIAKNKLLTICELPIKTQIIDYYLFWHKRYDQDSTNKWLRNICYEIFKNI